MKYVYIGIVYVGGIFFCQWLKGRINVVSSKAAAYTGMLFLWLITVPLFVPVVFFFEACEWLEERGKQSRIRAEDRRRNLR